MSHRSDMDMLDTNPYISAPDGGTNTYGVQSTIKRFKQVEAQRQRNQVIPIPRLEADPDILLEDDPIYSNKIQQRGDAPHLNGSRVVRERMRLISISSRHRDKWELEPLPRDPVTGDYTRLGADEQGNQVVVRYDAEILNAEYYWGLHDLLIDPKKQKAGYRHTVQLAEPFLEREGDIYVKREKDMTPNSYSITLNTPISHVKKIRLIASEIPNPYRTIGPHNSRIIFHIKNAETGMILPFKPDYRSIPFYLIEIPEGNYSLSSLIQIIQERANTALSQYSQCHKYNQLRFSVSADQITGVVRICLLEGPKRTKERPNGSHGKYEYKKHQTNLHSTRCKWIFHWRFWSHWSIPEEHTLYRMLGFARPYLKNCDGTDYYGPIYENIWRLGYGQSPTDPGAAAKELRHERGQIRPRSRPRPFAKINLSPETYIYLIIEGLNLTNDNILDTNPHKTIDNIFAKVQVCPGESSPSHGVNRTTDGCAMGEGCVGCQSLYDDRCGSDYLYNTAISVNKVYLESPLRILQTLKIRWVDAYGEPVDFGDREHSLTFEVVQFVDYLTETNFDSTRGVHPQ